MSAKSVGIPPTTVGGSFTSDLLGKAGNERSPELLLAASFTQFAWCLPFVILVLVQYPIYFVLPRMIGKGRPAFWFTITVLALVHVAGVVLCFAADRSENWRVLFRW